MALKIRTTGLEQYAEGGSAKVKALVIGGPGVGKTRWSSYFPKPIYLDCEGGLASVADRKVQFAEVKSSQDMLDALVFLKQESSRPAKDRSFDTVVVDTLDAFQRKVKDEWLLAHPGESAFRGFDAWGYLDAKMQMLATRLLNLDMNVIVAVHYTEKTISEGIGDQKTERQEYQLQLSGNIKDQIFNDFDLVGWMGTYFEMVDGQRQQKRGLTFKPTPDKPFLKDRLHVTPPWMEVTFAPTDYDQLFEAVASRMEDLTASEDFGEIPSATLLDGGIPSSGLAPALPGSGALPPQDPREVPLEQFDKPTLQKMARERNLEFKGNTLKGELVVMIKEFDAKKAAEPAADEAQVSAPEDPAPAAGDAPTEASAETPAATEAPASPSPEPVTEAGTAPQESQPAGVSEASPASAPTQEAVASAGAASTQAETAHERRDEETTGADDVPMYRDPDIGAGSTGAVSTVVDTPDAGPVDTATGEIQAGATEEQALETVTAALGGEVVSETVAVDAPPTPAAAAPAQAAQSDTCPGGIKGCPCGGVCTEDGEHGGPCTSAIGPNPDFIKLSFIKYRKHLCDTHYLARKKAS